MVVQQPFPSPVRDGGPVDVWWWDVHLGTGPALEALESVLSPAEVERAGRFRSPAPARAYIASHAGLRHILAGYTGSAPSQLIFDEGRHGKPFLSGNGPWRFNLAHSGSVAVCAVTEWREVGVDIEKVRQRTDDRAIARRFFTDPEQAALGALEDDGERQRAFFATWAAKEAYVKATGAGLSQGLRGFQVPVPVPAAPDGIQLGRWWLASLDIAPGYAAAMVADGPKSPVSVRKWAGSTGS